MRWISDVWFRLRALLAPGRMERDLEEEMAFHLEMETGKHLRDGLTPEEGARRARLTRRAPRCWSAQARVWTA